MRLTLVATLLLLPLALPTAPADTVTGETYGVDAYYASAGLWDGWVLHLPAGGTLTLDLTWQDSLLEADYDLTLWVPTAADDGAMTPSEVIGKSWTYARDPQHEQITVTLAPSARPYIVTVEAISTQGEPYALSTTSGDLEPRCVIGSFLLASCLQEIPSVKLGPPA